MSSENGYESDFRFRFCKMSLTVRVGLRDKFLTKAKQEEYSFVSVLSTVRNGLIVKVSGLPLHEPQGLCSC
jgi:hypothetical protein